MNDNITVIVQLGGGNDGLNTLIPLDTANYNAYGAARPTIGIQNPIELDASNSAIEIGLHPEAGALKSMWDAGKVSIIQGVHYTNPQKSHFKATDLMASALDGDTQAQAGNSWVGEFLNARYPNYPEDFPNVLMPDVLALGLGYALPGIAFNRGSGPSVGITLKGSPTSFRQLVNTVNQPSTNPLGLTRSKEWIAHWYGVDSGSDAYADALATHYLAQQNVGVYGTYGKARLSDQLKDVARLIGNGSKTPIYYVSIGGFDTHAGQVVSGNSATGAHADLIADLFGSVKDFHDDLQAMDPAIADRVTTMTASEFGRKVGENGSLGTDHGTLAPMFLFGNNVNSGLIGVNPDITTLNVNDYQASAVEFDYRRILATVLSDHMGAGPNQLASAGLNGYANLPLFTTPYAGTRDLAYNQ